LEWSFKTSHFKQQRLPAMRLFYFPSFNEAMYFFLHPHCSVLPLNYSGVNRKQDSNL
jgi:hypothetical protein